MNRKKLAIYGVPTLLFVLALWVSLTAAGVGGEASQLKNFLDQAKSRQTRESEIRQKLSGMGYEVAQNSTGSEVDAIGPHHSLLIYGTWLTVKVMLTPDRQANGYHIDRADRWF